MCRVEKKINTDLSNDWVKVNANFQSKSSSVVKDNELRPPAGAIQQGFECEV